jgi:Cu+-exporting ATPase
MSMARSSGIAIAVVLPWLVVASGNIALRAQTGGAAKQEQKAQTKVTDPTCGMELDPANAAGKSEYKGKTYYFCSAGCKKTFDANPEAVLNPKKKK